jgi:serine/threonine protein kinase
MYPRGVELYRHGLLVAHRTTPVAGQPAELWELAEPYDRDETMVELFVDAGTLMRRRKLGCFAKVVEATNLRQVVVAPPWVRLDAIIAGAKTRGGLPVELTLTLLHALARDLAALPGVAIRALSPSTIAVSLTGQPRLLDLTLARFEGRGARPTMAGVIKGELPFMAPEVAMGRSFDGRADVFGLGLVAYELIAGERAVRAKESIEILHEIRSAAFSHEPIAHLPPQALQILLDMIARDPERRPSWEHLASVLELIPRWSPERMADEIRRVVPAAVESAILYAI